MKIRKSLLLLFVIIFTSCSSMPSSITSSDSSVSSIISEELSQSELSSLNSSIIISESLISDPLEYYKTVSKRIEEDRANIKNLYFEGNTDKEIDEANRKCAKDYEDLIIKTQKALAYPDIRQRFVKEFGELEVRYIEAIDVKKMFYNRTLPKINYDEYIKSGNDIMNSIDNNEYYKTVVTNTYHFNKKCEEMIDAYYLYYIYKDLYFDNDNYNDEYIVCSSSLEEMMNLQKIIMKKLLNSKQYSDYTIETFRLTDEEIEEYKNSITYSDEMLELLNEENTLIGKYGRSGVDNASLFYNLIKVRKKIATKLGYDNYLEYAYDFYDRDYTIDEANSLISNIMNSKNIIAKYRTKDNNSYVSSLIGESDIFNVLKIVDNVVPQSPSILRDLRTYGNYSFDYRTNKYQGSYQITLDHESKNSYIFLGASGDVTDYLVALHEYGHYLSSIINPKDANLEISEIQSQGLELLCSNLLYKVLDQFITKYLAEYIIHRSLWTILSSCLIASFEYYVYTTDDLTLDMIGRKFNQMQVDYIYPSYLGSNGYTIIPHLYNSPGYYISYLVSIVPALELWAETKIEEGIRKYNIILNANEMNFKEAMEASQVISPFDARAVEAIDRKIGLLD